jgi:hypothetical protein
MVLTGRGMQQLLPALRAVDEFTITRNLMGAAVHILKDAEPMVKAELSMVGDAAFGVRSPARLREPGQSLWPAAGL